MSVWDGKKEDQEVGTVKQPSARASSIGAWMRGQKHDEKRAAQEVQQKEDGTVEIMAGLPTKGRICQKLRAAQADC